MNTVEIKYGLKTILIIIAVYTVCLLFRCLEFFLIRTDQTFFGEAFIHKLLGIAICFSVLFFLHIKPSDTGLNVRRAPKDILLGAILGISVYILAYGIELIILAASGKSPSLSFYVTIRLTVISETKTAFGFSFFAL